jgi:hypothetical protein
MRRILGAIFSAIKSAFAFLGRCAAAPFAALGGLGGRGAGPMPVAYDEPADTAEQHAENASKIAAAVLRWSADSAINDEPAAMPDGVPEGVQTWLRGLDRKHVYAILGADERAINAHLQGVFFIEGLPRVNPLPRAAWSRPEPASQNDAGSDLDLTGDWPSQSPVPA